MTKILMLFIPLLACEGFCCFGRLSQPALVVNGYFQDPIYYSTFSEGEDYKTHEPQFGYFARSNDDYLTFAGEQGTRYAGYGRLELAFGQSLIVNYFQDINDQCFLFSYTAEDLKQMKLAAGFSLGSDKAVFFLTKDGLQVISTAKYKQTRPTLKPHPYDPALCRPKPKYAIRAEYYLEDFPEKNFPKPVLQSMRQSLLETLASSRCKPDPAESQYCEETRSSLENYCNSHPGSELCRQTGNGQ